MNAAPAAPSAGTLGRLVGGAVMLVVAAVLLYYLYDYMFNVTQTQVKAAIVPSPIESPTTIVQYPGTTQTDIKLAQYVFTGGEMAITFWMYVTGAGSDTTNKRHILNLGRTATDDASTLIVALGGRTNTMYVHVNDGSTSSFVFNNFMTTTPDADSTAPCNVQNVEFGRWVNVTVVLNNNLCDVYMDGRLSRSCVLKGQFQVNGSTTTPLYFFLLNPDVGTTSAHVKTDWTGSLSGVNFYNYALSPDETYRIYMAGPSGSQGDLWSAVKSFFGALAPTAPVVPKPT
jgi:hypothetical protein